MVSKMGFKLLMIFIKTLRTSLKKAELRWRKSKLKMNLLVKTVKSVVHPMVFKLGRYGKFMACSNFPECRNTKAIVKQIGVKCPTCEEGEIVERKSKTKRIFYGCNQYPECDFVSWDKPISRPCPKCNAMLVEKKLKKGIQIHV